MIYDAQDPSANQLPLPVTAMTQQRPSDVRSLRAMFESQESTSPDDRGRSPNGHSPAPNDRPLSKVRSNFVSVEPSNPNPTLSGQSGAMDIDIERTKAQHGERASSTASFRREEFSFNDTNNGSAINDLKKTVSREGERRESNPNIYETIPEQAIEATPATTPAVEAKDYIAAGIHQTSDKADEEKTVHEAGSKLKEMTLSSDDAPAESSDLPPDHPDKPVTAAQEEPGAMKPSDPKEQATTESIAASNPTSIPDAHLDDEDLSSTLKESSPAADSIPAPTPRARRGSSVVPAKSSPSHAAIPSQGAAGSAPKPRRGSVIAPGEASLPSEPAARRQSIVEATGAPLAPSVSGSTPKPRRASIINAAEASLPTDPVARRASITSDTNKSDENSTPAPRTPPRSAAKRPPLPTIQSIRSPPAKSSTLSPKPPVRKPSRTSLSAATASSQTKTKAQGVDSKAVPTKTPTSQAPAAPKPSARSAKLSSHLTAPTAASAARQDAKPAVATRPPPSAQRQPRASLDGARPAARSSTTRPASVAATKKPESRSRTRAADDGFLARMMRPTASSANKTHEKIDVKSPPARTPSLLKSKAALTKPKAPKFEKSATSEPNTNGHAATSTEQKHDDSVAGVSTPQTEPSSQDNASMEATPAFDAETIR